MPTANPTKEQIVAFIRSECAALRLDGDIAVRQCECESAFNPEARSPVGAVGLFQLMPSTATWLKVDAYDWQANVRGGLLFMQSLLMANEWDYSRALASYNWGPGNLRKLMRTNPDDWRTKLPPETQHYITKILGR